MIQLINGECLTEMKKIPDNSIDFIFTDLPYGTTHCAWDNIIEWTPLWKEYNRILKKSGIIALFGDGGLFTANMITSNPNKNAFRYNWIWKKSKYAGFLNARKCPLRSYEVISIFRKPQYTTSKYYTPGARPVYNPQMREGKPYIRKASSFQSVYGKITNGEHKSNGTRYPIDVLEFNSEHKTQHPTQKPLALCEYIIKTYTNPGMTVLDNCMGSGTIGVAAVKNGCDFIGIELNKEYFDIATNRINEAMNK